MADAARKGKKRGASAPGDDTPAFDPLLTWLVDFHRAMPSTIIPITLTVGGGVVTGFLTSGEDFARNFAARWAPIGENVVRGVEEVLGVAPADRPDGGAGEGDESEPGERPTPRYVHLRQARFVSPGATGPSPPEFMWRGRLSEVTGFAIGIVE